MQRSLVLIGAGLVLLVAGGFLAMQGQLPFLSDTGGLGDQQSQNEITRSFPDGVAVPGRMLRVRLDFDLEEEQTVRIVERVSGLDEQVTKNKTVQGIHDGHIFYLVEVPQSVQASELTFSGRSPSLGIEISGNETVRVGQP